MRSAAPKLLTTVNGRTVRHRKTRLITAGLAVGVVLSFALALFIGDEPLRPADVFQALFGNGDSSTLFIVRELRLPRALIAIMAGLAFALSGALFQLLARNPLASPDLIGITAGASVAALYCILVLRWGGLLVSAGALVGALVTALIIYLLAYKGGVQGYRLVLVGIGVAAMASSVISYLLTRSEVRDAQYALSWLVGSLNGRVWTQTEPLFYAMLIICPLAVIFQGPLRALHLGDETAYGLGVKVEPAKLGLLLVAVLAAAVGTAAAGPIAFVALVSAPIARRMIPGGQVGLLPSMLVGAIAVQLSDVLAQNLLPGVNLPVGVVTGAVGAPYLLWLLVRTNKVGKG